MDARSLCALIRSVNPSGLDLPAAERERRYALKSRLQSLLVRRFAGEIEVERDAAEGEAFVLLRHRPSGTTAGHASITQLDEEARSWVQRALDLESAERPKSGAVPAPRPSSPGARSAVPAPRPSSSGAGRAVPAPRPSSPGARAASTARLRDSLVGAGETATLDELISAGKRAVDEYDYDLARRLFTRALDETGGDRRPARHLLSLLVDQLGADIDALAVVDSLDEDAAADPDVLGRLAIAAARLGDRPRARAFAKGLRDGAIAEVLVCLGTSAVAAGDLDAAAQDLREAEVTDPSHPEIAVLETALERARAARVGPKIDRIFALLAERRLDEAESVSRELRAAGASAPGAKEALLAVEEHRRRARTAQLVEEARRAMEQDLPEKAVSLLRQALLERPADSEGLADVERRLAEAESRHREATDTAAADSALRLLGGPDPGEGLFAYVGLSEGARARVRGASSLRALPLLDRTGVTGQGARARSAVAGVQALCRAEEVLEADPEGALALLAGHDRALESVPEASAVVKRAEALRKEKERAEARRRVQEVRRLLDPVARRIDEHGPHLFLGNDAVRSLRQAAALLTDATLRLLDEPDRGHAIELRESVARKIKDQEYQGTLNEMLSRFDLAGAKAFMADQLARRWSLPLDGPEAQLPLRKLDGTIQRMFHVCVAGEGAREMETRELGRAVITDEAVPMPDAWSVAVRHSTGAQSALRNGGRELVDITTGGRYVFLRRIDMAASPHQLRTFVVFRLPQPFRQFAAELSARDMVVVSRFGGLFGVSFDGYRVRAFRPGRNDFLPREAALGIPFPRTVEDVAFTDDLRSVRIIEVPDRGSLRLRGIEIDTLRKLHEEQVDEGGFRLATVEGLPQAAFAVLRGHETIELRGASGKPVSGGRFRVDVLLGSLVPFPGGGLFAVAREREGAPWFAVRLAPGKPTERLLALEDMPSRKAHGAAADLGASRIFLLAQTTPERRSLLAFDAERESGALTLAYRVQVPHRTLLLRDSVSGSPALLVAERGAFEVLPLGATPPELPASSGAVPFVEVPGTMLLGKPCHGLVPEREKAVAQIIRSLRAQPEQQSDRIQSVLERSDPLELLNMSYAFGFMGQADIGAQLERRALDRHPDDPLVRWTRATLYADFGEWSTVREYLEGLPLERLGADYGRHFAHLLGLALLSAGEHDEAYRVLLRGLECAGECELGLLAAIAAPPGEPVLDVRVDVALHELSCRVAAADERLAAGDPEGVVALLDDVLVWEASEVQSLARLARALLDLSAGASVDRKLRTFVALARFIDSHTEKSIARSELFFRGRWTTEKLDALVVEAQAWIDQQMDG